VKSIGQRARDAARSIELRTRAIYLASRDPRVPRMAKTLAVVVAAYALSPIDLIPDVIPVLGYLDDLVLVPLGIALVIRLIPRDVWCECLDAAGKQMEERLPRNRTAAVVIVLIWIAALALLAWAAWSQLRQTAPA
jgi:uncharacterized membrane protein YkvA (DUF1232 family)